MNFSVSDDDEFAPNPFRSNNGSNDFLGSPNPPAPAPAMSMNYNNQPDPYSGMTGSLPPSTPSQLPNQQQQLSPDPSSWSGTMDQRAPAVENYGASGTRNNGQVESTPFNFFSLNSWIACCTVDAYSKYFDLDTADVVERLKASLLKFHQPDQFRTAVVGDFPTETLKGPDLYGPVWITMTLVFVLAATSNIYAFWEHHKAKRSAAEDTPVEDFEVDIRHLLRACNVVMFFVFGMSSAFWLAASCMGMPAISWGLWVCCYGYSQMPFMLAAIGCCIFPLELLTWILMGTAGVASGLLIVRNLSTPLMGQDGAGNAKSAPIIMAMMVVHFIYILVVKFTFFP